MTRKNLKIALVNLTLSGAAAVSATAMADLAACWRKAAPAPSPRKEAR